MAVPINLITAFGMALLLNTEGLKGKKFYRTIAYMPYVVPAVATAFLWRWLFNPSMGLMNTILEAVGLPPSQWIFSERTVLPSIAMMVIWSIGANMIIYLAGLQGVPRSLYDAIEVDGGGIFSKFRYATLPMMTPTIFFTLIMGIIHNLQAFFQAFIMTEGGPNNGSLFFAYHIYRTGFVSNNMSRASALSWVLFVIVMFFTAFIFLSSKKWVYYEGGDNQ
ncbi:MAG: sugar ABC transporter permease [Defluviitaleaceae bacterium]|nr:sugar ABC transporter permease [Defluviitaleaceae bacterium]